MDKTPLILSREQLEEIVTKKSPPHLFSKELLEEIRAKKSPIDRVISLFFLYSGQLVVIVVVSEFVHFMFWHILGLLGLSS